MKRPRYKLAAGVLLIAVCLPGIPWMKPYLPSQESLLSIYWAAIFFLLLFLFPGSYVPGKRRIRKEVYINAVVAAAIYISLHYVTAAFLKLLAGSPYDRSLSGIVNNVLILFPALIARESVRAYGIGCIWKDARKRGLWLVLLTLILALAEVNYAGGTFLTDVKQTFIFCAEKLLPAITKNVLLTVLCFYGGSKAGVLYGGIVGMFWRLFPFLPDLSWFATAVIGIVFPVVYAMVVMDRFKEQQEAAGRGESSLGYGISLAVSIALVWFCVGVFPIYPNVVLTGSMEPDIMPGDVVLIKKFTDEAEVDALQVGDVINFNRGEINITHRITKIQKDEAGNLSFNTKGDNNASEDVQEVAPGDIKGIVTGSVPKVGLPVLWIKGNQEVPEGVVDAPEE